MRRPSATNAADDDAALVALALSQKQMQTSNETVNMFLGGRQPAWLTGGLVNATPTQIAPGGRSSATRRPSTTTALNALGSRRPVPPTPTQTQQVQSPAPLATQNTRDAARHDCPPPAPVLPSPPPSEDSNQETARLVDYTVPALHPLPTHPQVEPVQPRKRPAESPSIASLKRARGENTPRHSAYWVQESPGEASHSAANTFDPSVQGQDRQRSNGEQMQVQMQHSIDGNQHSTPSQPQTSFSVPHVGTLTTAPLIFNSSNQLRSPAMAVGDIQNGQRRQSSDCLSANGPVSLPTTEQSHMQAGVLRRPSHTIPSNMPWPSEAQHHFTSQYEQQAQQQQAKQQQAQQQQARPQEAQQQQAQQKDARYQQLQLQQMQLEHQQGQQMQRQRLQRIQQQEQEQELQRQQQLHQITGRPANLPYHSSMCMPNFRSRTLGLQGTLSKIAQGRIEVMQTAIELNDAAFLFMHQILCLHSVNNSAIPQQLRVLPTFEAAINALDNILALNSSLDQSLVEWFSVFPIPLSEVAMNWTQTYHTGVEDLKQLFWRLGQNWPGFYQECKRRDYPPLASELLNSLGVQSPVLMELLFTATMRSTWYYDKAHPIYAYGRDLFMRNRDWYLDRLSKNPPLSDDERIPIDKFYVQQYLQCRSQFDTPQAQDTSFGSRRTQSLGVDTTTLRSNAHRTGTSGSPNLSASPLGPSHAVDSTRQSLGTPSAHSRPPTERIPTQDRGYTVRNAQHPTTAPSLQQPQLWQRQSTNVSPPLLILPSKDARAPPMPANPTWKTSALHQAHLRSPLLSSDDFLTAPKSLLYQYLAGFALEPKRLTLGTLVPVRSFSISPEEKALIPLTMHSSSGKPPTRILTEQSVQYRLRCSRLARSQSQSEEQIEEKNWVTAETSYPTYVYLTFNKQRLEIRRKLHFGKDLPIDITQYVVAGVNTLEIFLNTTPDQADIANYAFAVEVIRVKNHDTIIQECNERLQPASEVISSIKQSLTEAPTDDDDTIVMVSQNITINLYDPITLSQTCTTPVRSVHCVHRHCFDLGSFLQTRERAKPTSPSIVDVWRCPICRGDARPQTLVVDGFMLDVHKLLAVENNQGSRAIIMQQNGSWKPRMEKKDDSEQSSRAASSAGKLTTRDHSSTTSPAQTPAHTSSSTFPHSPFSFGMAAPEMQNLLAPSRLQQGESRRPVDVIELGSDSE